MWFRYIPTIWKIIKSPVQHFHKYAVIISTNFERDDVLSTYFQFKFHHINKSYSSSNSQGIKSPSMSLKSTSLSESEKTNVSQSSSDPWQTWHVMTSALKASGVCIFMGNSLIESIITWAIWGLTLSRKLVLANARLVAFTKASANGSSCSINDVKSPCLQIKSAS